MRLKTKIFIEVCQLYCESDSLIDGVKPESYHIKVAFDWRDVILINECSEDSDYTIVICKGSRLTIKKDFDYCLGKFLSSRSAIISIN